MVPSPYTGHYEDKESTKTLHRKASWLQKCTLCWLSH